MAMVSTEAEPKPAVMAVEEMEPPRPGRPPLRLTRRVLFVCFVISLVDCINSTMLVPYVDAFVASALGKERGDPAVAGWVALLVGSYSVCEVLFSGMWGMLSDRIGRRPVLLVGLAGSAIAPVIFGLSKSLPLALAARLLDGFFCGNVGVTRTYIAELADPSNEAQAFSLLALSFSVGVLIGPTLGGMLSEPAERMPTVFVDTVFEDFPYLLPNLCYATVALAALVVGVFSLQETQGEGSRTARRQLQQRLVMHNRDVELPESAATATSAWNPKLLRLLLACGLLSGYTAGRLQSFVLVMSLPQHMGGLALAPQDFGCLQVVASIVILITQLFAYKPLLRILGPHLCYTLGVIVTVLLTIPLPFAGLMADPDKFGLWRLVPVAAWQGLSQVGFSMAFPTSFMLVNRECSPCNRGAVNGWQNSFSALCRGIFPFLAAGLVSFGCKMEGSPLHLVGGRYLSFFVNMAFAFTSATLVWRQRPSVLSSTAAAAAHGDRSTGLRCSDPCRGEFPAAAVDSGSNSEKLSTGNNAASVGSREVDETQPVQQIHDGLSEDVQGG